MNTNSPLIPQGTTPARGKSSLYFKVLMILTVHVVLIGGMLLQGCKDTGKEQAKESAATNPTDLAAATNSTQETMPTATAIWFAILQYWPEPAGPSRAMFRSRL